MTYLPRSAGLLVAFGNGFGTRLGGSSLSIERVAELEREANK